MWVKFVEYFTMQQKLASLTCWTPLSMCVAQTVEVIGSIPSRGTLVGGGGGAFNQSGNSSKYDTQNSKFI